eukprot:CAMPEP_0172800200 /NCGR_PEP_ID=MMETSP1075-20121228/2428_1 /TAXON_ID=2916 /ORGANISM="Ceratium fusus, Strain PA161109" /LENGTH=116 /DNA_ID=CAMNT_0013638069 /DNA_START=92 /DNA_END=442 /DNA_ORIENTATION=+
MFAAIAQGWQNLYNRLHPGEGPINSDRDQDMLNRINLGNYRVATESAGGAVLEIAAPPAVQPGTQLHPQQSESRVGGVATEQRIVQPQGQGQQSLDADRLRSQRLAHFESRQAQQQ